MTAPAYTDFRDGDPVIVEFVVDGQSETRQGTFVQARKDSLWMMPTSGPAAGTGIPMSVDWDIITSVTRMTDA